MSSALLSAAAPPAGRTNPRRVPSFHNRFQAPSPPVNIWAVFGSRLSARVFLPLTLRFCCLGARSRGDHSRFWKGRTAFLTESWFLFCIVSDRLRSSAPVWYVRTIMFQSAWLRPACRHVSAERPHWGLKRQLQFPSMPCWLWNKAVLCMEWETSRRGQKIQPRSAASESFTVYFLPAQVHKLGRFPTARPNAAGSERGDEHRWYFLFVGESL